MTGCPKGGNIDPVLLAAAVVSATLSATCSLPGFAVFPCLLLYDVVVARGASIMAGKPAETSPKDAPAPHNGHDDKAHGKKRFHMFAYAPKGPTTQLERVEAAFRGLSPSTAAMLRSSLLVAVCAWLAAEYLAAGKASLGDAPARTKPVLPFANPAAYIAADAVTPSTLTSLYATASHFAWLAVPLSLAMDWSVSRGCCTHLPFPPIPRHDSFHPTCFGDVGFAPISISTLSIILFWPCPCMDWLSVFRSFSSVRIIDTVLDARNVFTLAVFLAVVSVAGTWAKLAVIGRSTLGGRTPEKYGSP